MPSALFQPARKRVSQPVAPTQRSLARRALVEPRRWTHRGIAALAVALLGVGTAGSVVLVGNAELPTTGGVHQSAEVPAVQRSVNPSVPRPKAFLREAATTRNGVDRATRDATRPALGADSPTSVTAAAKTRSADLAANAAATKKKADRLAEKRAEKRAKERAEKRAAERERRQQLLGDGKATLPVPGARVAAGFGATGAWARYHTGIDFSAGSGTQIHAPRAGTVTTAGSGRASGWAGTYVVIKHSDGTSSLYAHMSSVDVSVGDEVDAGRVIGRVGQTGRAFGPHLHFEIYPAGVEAGDVYNAVDPWPWLRDLGL